MTGAGVLSRPFSSAIAALGSALVLSLGLAFAQTPPAVAANAPGVTSNPLSGGVAPLAPLPTTTSTTATAVNNSSTSAKGSSTLSSESAFGIVIGAIIVLCGIAFFIWRDARRRAPVRAGEGPTVGRRVGSKPPPKQRKLSQAERRRRKRGKAR
ncbi:MAG: hypothetical protein ACRDMX_07450 [Solirubrobacteraceae bacterium]